MEAAPSTKETRPKKPLTKRRLAIAIFFFALGVSALAFRESDAANEVPIEVYASLLLLFGLAIFAFGLLASDRLLLKDLKPGRQVRPRTLRIFYVVTAAAFVVLGLAGLLA